MQKEKRGCAYFDTPSHHSKVVDAETGEPVDFVTIGVGTRMHLLSNEEGEFTITAEADEEVSFSRIGYEKLRMAARKLGREVRLKPLVKSLAEVTVLPIPKDEILRRCIANLEKDYTKGKKKDRLYFSRTIFVDEEGNEMLEAFMRSQAAVNLRNPQIVSGILSQDRNVDGSVRSTNVHRLLEVGPKVYESQFWKRALLPLDDWDKVSESYDVSYSLLTGDDSLQTYRFDLRHTKKFPAKWNGSKTVIEGSLYIRANDFRLLQFDGEVINLSMRVRDPDVPLSWMAGSKPTTMSIHMEYNYENGYAEVANLSLQGGDENMKYRTILFNVPDTLTGKKRNVRVGENLVKAITDADIDSTLWASTNIIQRTENEERLAFGMPSELYIQDQRTKFSPDTTWTDNPRLRALRDRLFRSGMSFPQEKVFIHLDNTCYFQGDTVWFSAYTRQTNTDLPSKVSGVLYVELLDNDGFLMERKYIEMRKGQSQGFFALDKDIQYSGFYELRAYTRWQLNWGITEHWHSKASEKWFMTKTLEHNYYRDYDKLYSRIFPVYDKPAEAGLFQHDMTLRPQRRYFKKDMDEEERKPVLTLFPEGGNLVAGVPNRIAFEACMSDGEQLEGMLTVGNETIPAVNRGRGVFTLTPEKGMEREVTFTTKDGQKVSAKLPKPEEQGVALSVRQEGSDWVISTQAVGNLVPDSLAVMVTNEGTVESVYEFKSQHIIQDSLLPAGIHQVTVFDTQGRVWADRLFFVTKPELTKPTITVSGLKDEYKPYEKIEMKVAALAPPSIQEELGLSLSVRDGYQQDHLFDNGNIMTEMLLASEVKGFIPNPGWFFEKDDEEHRQALDLLMMTQGWRRFNWRDMAVMGEWDLTQPKEKTPILQGQVFKFDVRSLEEEIRNNLRYNYLAKPLEKEPRENNSHFSPELYKKSKSFTETAKDFSDTHEEWNIQGHMSAFPPQKEVFIDTEILGIGSGERIFLATMETNRLTFKLKVPRFYNPHVFFFDVSAKKKNTVPPDAQPRRKKKKGITISGVGADEGFKDHHIYFDHPFPRFVKPYTYYQSTLSHHIEYKGDSIGEQEESTTLKEVSVHARHGGLRRFDDSQPAFILGDLEAENLMYDSGIALLGPDRLGRTLFGDMGLEFPYVASTVIRGEDGGKQSKIIARFGISPTRRSTNGESIPRDSTYSRKYLKSYPPKFGYQSMSPKERNEYQGIGAIEKYVIYTDYSPRREGSRRYWGANLPEVDIVKYPYSDGSRHPVYADRALVLPGFAYPAEFYNPDYSKQTPPEPTDYRRTLYWNPSLQLDEKGEAHVTLWNNSRTTHPNVEAAGQTAEGGLLWNK